MILAAGETPLVIAFFKPSLLSRSLIIIALSNLARAEKTHSGLSAPPPEKHRIFPRWP
jgi:hypothetical protein